MWANDRTTDHRESCCASLGRCSQIETLGTVVEMVENSPRISAGPSGFGSSVSSWLGPPLNSTSRTDLALPVPTVGSTAQYAVPGSAAPITPAAPILRK